MPNDYKSLAELDYQILRFQRFSDQAARNAGLEPRQDQLMLALKGLPEDGQPTIREVAERIQTQHHSAVGLVNRLVARGFLVRRRCSWDRRVVLLQVTPAGEAVLRNLAGSNLRELRNGLGTSLVGTITRIKAPQGSSRHGKS